MQKALGRAWPRRICTHRAVNSSNTRDAPIAQKRTTRRRGGVGPASCDGLGRGAGRVGWSGFCSLGWRRIELVVYNLGGT